jgi:plasmid maintenance system antidote protein VapI
VTVDMAARLSRAFGNSTRFWLNLQANHDAWDAERRLRPWTSSGSRTAREWRGFRVRP